jgi:hypothetical protein
MIQPINWNGHLPVRRYAMFTDVRGDYAIVVTGDDIRTAPNWGGFIGWLGPLREAVYRNPKYTPYIPPHKVKRYL